LVRNIDRIGMSESAIVVPFVVANVPR
jgi:hypothetical protein